MASKSEALKAVLDQAGINTRRVTVLGSFAHVDTFAKYENALRDLMGNAGFRLLRATDGEHMDSFSGFRMTFQVAA